MYHKLLESLANQFREFVRGHRGGSQVFITTHQPYFIDLLEPKEVWILEKGEDGFSTISRASDDLDVNNVASEQSPSGDLWYSSHLKTG